MAEKEPTHSTVTVLEMEVDEEEGEGFSVCVYFLLPLQDPLRAAVLPVWFPFGDFSHPFSYRVLFLSMVLLIKQE